MSLGVPQSPKPADHEGSGYAPGGSNVRIVAVVGSNDYGLREDERFFSDFYCLHHMLKETTAPQHQRWLTCVHPKVLVEKHGELTYRSSRTDRVVLDSTILEEVQDVTYVPPNDLRDTFLQILSDWSTECARMGQHLLVILLARGQPFNSDKDMQMLIGGSGKTQDDNQDRGQDQDNGPVDGYATTENRFDLSQLGCYINSAPKVAILTTACYSSRWVVSPELPDLSMLTPVGTMQENQSWSTSIRDTCCSRFITAITDDLVQSHLSDVLVVDHNEDDIERSAIGRHGPIYSSLASAVARYLTEIHRPSWKPAVDEKWATDWHTITGFRETDVAARFTLLKGLSRNTIEESGCERRTEPVSTDMEESGQHLDYELDRTYAKQLALDYLNSHPSCPSFAKNHAVNYHCWRLTNNESIPYYELQDAILALHYRLYNVTAMATKYRDVLGVDFPACEEWDEDSYRLALHNKEEEGKTKLELWTKIRSALHLGSLFHHSPESGWLYAKGSVYLGALMAEQLWDLDTAREAFEKLQRWQKRNTGVATPICEDKLVSRDGFSKSLIKIKQMLRDA